MSDILDETKTAWAPLTLEKVSKKPSEEYFDLSEESRNNALLTARDAQSAVGDSCHPQIVRPGPFKEQLSGRPCHSPSKMAFIDAFGGKRTVLSLEPQADKPPSGVQTHTTASDCHPDSSRDTPPPNGDPGETLQPNKDVLSEQPPLVATPQSDPMVCDAPNPTAPHHDQLNSNAIVEPPAVGARFQSREEFKNACQSHAMSLSASDPSKKFHFATRTSSLGKWLVFSCHKHVKGCPVAVRVELDKSTQHWVVTSAYYQHSHFSYEVNPSAETAATALLSCPTNARRFSVIRKSSSESGVTSFTREDTPDLTDWETTSGTVPSVKRQRFKHKRSYSDTGSKKARARSLVPVPDGSARAAFLQQQKRNLHRLSAPPAQAGLDPIVASPRIKSDRERGLLLRHNTSHSRTPSDAGDPDLDRSAPPSPAESTSSVRMSRRRSSSEIFSDHHYTHIAMPSFETSFNSTHSQLLGVWGTPPSRSCSPAPASQNLTMREYLSALHPLLGDLEEAFKGAGVNELSILLSLEKPELEALVDAFKADQSSKLQKMLAKNRIGRSLN